MKLKIASSRIIAPDGIEVRYWVTKTPEMNREFRVFHPGASMNHSSLEAIEVGSNAQGYPTVTMDPRGTGYSNAPTSPEFYGLDRYSGDLEMILRKEGIESPVLIGHSAGFMTVVNYVARNNSAQQVVGICGSQDFSQTTSRRILFEWFDRIFRYGEYLGSTGMKMMHVLNGEARSYQDQSKLGTASEFAVWLSIVDTTFEKVRANTVSGHKMAHWNIVEQLKELTTPLVLIYGSKDQMVTPQTGDYIRTLIRKNCPIEIVEGTHSLPMKKPEEILALLRKHSLAPN